MISDELEQKVRSRTFWNVPVEQNILPAGQLVRQSYLNDLESLAALNVVIAVLGIRRGGKSVLVKQYIQHLRNTGIPPVNILYLNFFLRPLAEVKQEKVFVELVEWWRNEVADNTQKCFLILDEVQDMEHWDVNVASIFEDHTLDCQIIITGSNSKMLSNHLDTSLGGRYTRLQVFPFSYQEYCRFTEVPQSMDSLEQYLITGGMAEPMKTQHEEQRERLIQDIINSTVERDIVQRNNISDPRLLNDLIDYCRFMFSRELSVKNIENEVVKTLGDKQSSSFISEYLGYIEDVFFIHMPETYSYRSKDVLKRSVNKVYLADTCFALYQSGTEKGRLLENMVHTELLRQQYKVQRYFAYKNKNLEVDFWAEKSGSSMLIQVCWYLGDPAENETLWRREFGNLKDTKMEVKKWVVSMDSKVVSPYASVNHMNIMEFLQLLNS